MTSKISKITDLVANGYHVIPTTSDRRPLVKNWKSEEGRANVFTSTEWIERFPDASISLVSGFDNVFGIDFYFRSEDQCNNMMAFIKNKIGDFPIRRIGNLCFGMVFYGESNLSECIAINSDMFTDGTKKQFFAKVKIKEPFLLYSSNSKSKITWTRKNLMNINYLDVPFLATELLTIILKYFTRLFVGYHLLKNKSLPSPKNNQKKKYTEDKIDEMLSIADPSTKDEALKIGKALHYHYDGSIKGLTKWIVFCVKFSHIIKEDECRGYWSDLSEAAENTTSIYEEASIFTEDREDSARKVLEMMCKNYVFIIKNRAIVGDLTARPPESLIPLNNLKLWCMNKRISSFPDNSNLKVAKNKTAYDLWMESPYRQDAYDITYIPVRDRLIRPSAYGFDNNKMYYNMYSAPPHIMTKKDDLVHYFVNHIKYIFPNDNWQYAMNFMAQILQNPLKRFRTALFSVCVYEMTGRGWLTKLMSLLYGQTNTTTTRKDSMISPDAKNGYLKNSLLCFVNEVQGDRISSATMSDTLKTLLSDDMQMLDIKYGEQSYNHVIYTRFFIQSNYINGLKITKDDSRIIACISQAKPRSKDYYKNLYGLIEGKRRQDFLNQVYSYLTRWKVNETWLQEAPMTEDKRLIIAASHDDNIVATFYFYSVVGDLFFTRDILIDFIKRFAAYMEDSTVNIEKTQRRVIYATKTKRSIKFKDQNIELYSRTIENLGSQAPVNEIIDSYKKARTLIQDYFERK